MVHLYLRVLLVHGEREDLANIYITDLGLSCLEFPWQSTTTCQPTWCKADFEPIREPGFWMRLELIK